MDDDLIQYYQFLAEKGDVQAQVRNKASVGMCAGKEVSARAVEWGSSCLATALLHRSPLKVASVLALFLIFKYLIKLICT